ncbi:GntR family transcriptional regulator [Thermoplasma sp. Kam2015]|uniref:GntR family transcriptional regulator n=1 Tax=Thermoplasma sp. Kam2015 TaxID=2094122 RepID=UPI000D8C24B7|nr:GntR family transcriptional regulator [Thermoplasma sp. Kam2015]PYB69007.1 GntR family transcriptional regulator [Thermoplasma sp. Kam2015]
MEQSITLSKKIYNYIIEEITSGHLRMGQIIDENGIMELFGSSKTPIREAILSLENDGIIEKRGKSYFVCFIEPDEINQIFEARRELEAIAVYYAAKRIQKAELKQLSDILKKIRKSTDEDEPADLANLNGKFHSIIARASRNKYIENEVNLLRLKLRIVRVTLFTSIERRSDELAEHSAIYEALANGDAEKARTLMYNHETDVWEYVNKYIIPKLYY